MISNVEYAVNIHLETRDNARVSLGRRSINIRVPNNLPREELFKTIRSMKAWAQKKILETPERYTPKEHKNYIDGQTLRIGTEDYLLRIDFRDKESSSARIAGHTILLRVSSHLSETVAQKHIATLISRSVARKRLPELQKRIENLNDLHFKQGLGKIFFKNNTSNWGSCSTKGNINISTRLLFSPEEVLEYVCIHELAHLIEHNHSERFWALVNSAMPNYNEKKNWLKENGSTCEF